MLPLTADTIARRRLGAMMPDNCPVTDILEVYEDEENGIKDYVAWNDSGIVMIIRAYLDDDSEDECVAYIDTHPDYYFRDVMPEMGIVLHTTLMGTKF